MWRITEHGASGARANARVLMHFYRTGQKSNALASIHKFSGADVVLLLNYMWEEPITGNTRSRVRSYIRGIGYDPCLDGMPPHICYQTTLT
jgi:hypothetical protein